MLDELCTPDFDTVVNNTVINVCHLVNVWCYKTFFICTLNESKVIFVTFNLNCR